MSREKLAELPHCASAFLMGCSSGRLESLGQFEPSGVVQSYFLAGAKTVVANLWDVTDKDIDRFTLGFLERWLFQGEDLASALKESRDTCKLPFLVGAAPVYYGLPLMGQGRLSLDT